MNRTLITLVLCSVACAGSAQTVYKWVMPDGSIRYSDRPQEEGALTRQEVTIVGAQAPGAPDPTPTLDPAAEADPDAGDEPVAGYDSFEITAPSPDAAIRDNGGNVSIQLALDPPLDPEHVIELFMDGASVGTGRTTTITMTNVDRGSHTVQASIRDQSGARLATTAAVTFNLLRVAAGS